MSQYPVFTAGQKLTAAALQQLAPIRLMKAADQSVTSSTTVVNDNDLVVPVAANATYDFDGFIFWIGNETGKIKFGMNAPTGATLDWGLLAGYDGDTGFNTGGTHGAAQFWLKQAQTTFPTGTIQYAASTALLTGLLKGRITTGSTAGNLTLQWAQFVSNATSTTLKAGSWLHAQRVG